MYYITPLKIVSLVSAPIDPIANQPPVPKRTNRQLAQLVSVRIMVVSAKSLQLERPFKTQLNVVFYKLIIASSKNSHASKVIKHISLSHAFLKQKENIRISNRSPHGNRSPFFELLRYSINLSLLSPIVFQDDIQHSEFS